MNGLRKQWLLTVIRLQAMAAETGTISFAYSSAVSFVAAGPAQVCNESITRPAGMAWRRHLQKD
jgi:hypothetical protein